MTYYKVLSKVNKKYYSAIVGNGIFKESIEHRVRYFINATNAPRLPNSKLMVFGDLAKAIEFANSEIKFFERDIFVICPCTVTNPVAAKKVAGCFSGDSIKQFWDTINVNLGGVIAPSSSFYCDSIFLCPPIVYVNRDDHHERLLGIC